MGATGAETVTCPPNGVIRDELRRRFRTASDFDAFLLDEFPSVKQRCSDGMDQVMRCTLLLEIAGPEQVWNALCRYETATKIYQLSRRADKLKASGIQTHRKNKAIFALTVSSLLGLSLWSFAHVTQRKWLPRGQPKPEVADIKEGVNRNADSLDMAGSEETGIATGQHASTGNADDLPSKQDIHANDSRKGQHIPAKKRQRLLGTANKEEIHPIY